MKFARSELVKILITGEIGMIIDRYIQTDYTDHSDYGYEPGYRVRLSDYSVHKFYEFELGERPTKEE